MHKALERTLQLLTKPPETTTFEGEENKAKDHYGLQVSERPDGHAIKHFLPCESLKLEHEVK